MAWVDFYGRLDVGLAAATTTQAAEQAAAIAITGVVAGRDADGHAHDGFNRDRLVDLHFALDVVDDAGVNLALADALDAFAGHHIDDFLTLFGN